MPLWTAVSSSLCVLLWSGQSYRELWEGLGFFLFRLLTEVHLSSEKGIHDSKGNILALLQMRRKLPSEPFRLLDQRQHLWASHFQSRIPPAGPQIWDGRGLSSYLHFLKHHRHALINAAYALILTQICSHKIVIVKRPHKCARSSFYIDAHLISHLVIFLYSIISGRNIWYLIAFLSNLDYVSKHPEWWLGKKGASNKILLNQLRCR